MPVNRRGTSWQAQVNYRGQRYRLAFATQKEAQAWHDETLEILKAGGSLDPQGRKPRLMGELIDYVWDTHYQHQRGGAIVRYFLDHLKGLHGTTPITAMGKYEIDKLFSKWRGEGNSDNTLSHKSAYLSRLFRTAVELGIIPAKPALPTFKMAEHRTRVLDLEEERKLLGFFELRSDVDMVDYISVSIDTGIRKGEALSLTIENLDGPMLRLFGDQTKNFKGRSVPLTTRSSGILHARARVVAGKAERLFSGLSGRSINDRWNEARAAMGMIEDEDFVPHALRHTFCSRLGRLGFNAQTIQAMSGHSTLQQVQRYCHMDEDTLSAAIERLGNRFNLMEAA